VKEAFTEGPPACIINCAAYTAVDQAEDEPELCRRLNADGPGNIAAVAAEIGAKFIHISTDYVFDAAQGSVPYTEAIQASPASVYGKTKYEGELAAARENPNTYIVRTAWLYGRHGKNFVSTMIRLFNEKDTVSVVNDQRGIPTSACDLAEAVATMAVSTAEPGVYHYTGTADSPQGVTWYDFASEIYRQGRSTGLVTRDCTVAPCSSDQYPAKAKRPAFSVLATTKISQALSLTVPNWQRSLTLFMEELCAL
jgi:dTDP-4-dehydrorhamnose reductase